MIGVEDPSARDWDVAIAGAGAAGLTLAAELAGQGLSVLVLEAGGLKETRASAEAYAGELEGDNVHPRVDAFRVRAAGGATRIWGGRCTPLDEADFASRPWVPGPGWPFGLNTVAAYYDRAQAAVEAGPYDYEPASALPGRPPEFLPGLDGATFRTRLERFSKPTNFWRRFEPVLAGAQDVHVALETPVTAVRLAADGGQVDHLEVDRDGRRLKVRARRYVLALGGFETVRLMMASNDVLNCGAGGRSGHLGRYYMSHVAGTAGAIRLNPGRAIHYDYERDGAGVYVRRRLWLTSEAQREIQGLNIIFRTNFPEAADPSHGDPILSGMFLAKNFILYEYSRRMLEQQLTLGDYARHGWNIARHPMTIVRFGTDWLRRRTFAERKLPSIVLKPQNGLWAIEFHAEQAPNPESRLTLSDQRDALGLPRLKVHWALTALDVESVQRAYGVLARELERSGVGQLVYTPEEVAARIAKDGSYGGHHIGTARMAADPNAGVVDPDCRVHGTPNLFLASAAVFPTSSQANPTLTIVALACRLADQLKAELKA